MKPLIKFFLSTAAVFAASSSVFGLTVLDKHLNDDGPVFSSPEVFVSPETCATFDSASFFYAAHPIEHPGGMLDVSLESTDFYASMGIYQEAFDPEQACKHALAYQRSFEQEAITYSADLPKGRYILVATSYDFFGSGQYRLTIRTPETEAVGPVEVQAVPAATMPALALSSLVLLGAAGFVARRKKSGPKKLNRSD